MKKKFSRYAPPGYSVKNEYTIFVIGMVLSLIASFTFITRLDSETDRMMMIYNTQESYGITRIFPEYSNILGGALAGFIITAVLVLIFIPVRYMYMKKESNSIYTVKLMGEKSVAAKMCVVQPALESVIAVVMALIMYFVYMAVYYYSVPRVFEIPPLF